MAGQALELTNTVIALATDLAADIAGLVAFLIECIGDPSPKV